MIRVVALLAAAVMTVACNPLTWAYLEGIVTFWPCRY